MDLYELESTAATILRLIERNRKLEKLARLTQETREAQKTYFSGRKQNLPATTINGLLQHSKIKEAETDTLLNELLNPENPF